MSERCSSQYVNLRQCLSSQANWRVVSGGATQFYLDRWNAIICALSRLQCMAITNQSQRSSRQTKKSKRPRSKKIARKGSRSSRPFQSKGSPIHQRTFFEQDLLSSLQTLQRKYTLGQDSPHEVSRRETVRMMTVLSRSLQLGEECLLLGVYLLDKVLLSKKGPEDIREIGFCALMVSSKFNKRGHPRLESWANLQLQPLSRAHLVQLQAQILSAVDYDLGFVTYLQFLQLLSPPLSPYQLQCVLTINQKALLFPDFHCFSSRSRALASSRIVGWASLSEGEWGDQLHRCEASLRRANDQYL